MRYIILMVIFVSSVLCQSCGTKSTLSKMLEQKVVLDSLTPIFLGNEMGDKVSVEPKYARLVVYFDSTVCQPCRINRLYEWESIISLEAKYDYQFDVMFIFSPSYKQQDFMCRSFATNRFRHIVWFDKKGIFRQINRFVPDDSRFHTFLLNRDNEIALVGNPLSNQNIRVLFDNTLNHIIECKGDMPALGQGH